MTYRSKYNVFIKIWFSIIIFVFFAELIILPFLNYNALKQAYKQEINTVQNILGSIAEKYPDFEMEFISALKFNNNSFQSKGEEILKHYGYDENNILTENITYKNIMKHQNFIFILFLITTIILLITAIIYFIKKRKKENEFILYIINNYISENYENINKIDKLKALHTDNILDQIIDSLNQLGKQIYLKNLKINDEKESTKALVTDISHQLKTPVASLKTCFSMYVEAETKEEKEEFLMHSNHQINRLEGLISALVNISRLEMAMITLKCETVSLQETLIDAVNGIYEKARLKKITLELEPFEDIYLKIDKKWTTEAIANVLENAVKYSYEGGSVTISVQKMVNFVRVEISDTGIGIEKEDYNKIFQRFYRGINDIVRKSEGSGVGLYLTRFIFEKQKGSISVKSVYGKGSTFILQLRLL